MPPSPVLSLRNSSICFAEGYRPAPKPSRGWRDHQEEKEVIDTGAGTNIVYTKTALPDRSHLVPASMAFSARIQPDSRSG